MSLLIILIFFLTCRSENVFAIVELLFGNSATDPLKPLQDEINDGNLGSFIVDRTLDENPSMSSLTL